MMNEIDEKADLSKFNKLKETMKTKERLGLGGSIQEYIPVEYVVERINAVMGLNWSFEIVSKEFIQTGKNVKITKNNRGFNNTKEEPKDSENENTDTESKVLETEVKSKEEVDESENISGECVALVRIHYFLEDGSARFKDGIGGKVYEPKIGLGNGYKASVSLALVKAAQLLGIDNREQESTSEQHETIIKLVVALGGLEPPIETLSKQTYAEANKLIVALNEKVNS